MSKADPRDVMPSGDVDGCKIVPTEEGNAALKKGRAIYNESGRIGIFAVDHPSREALEETGKASIIEWFGVFYRRMMSDPRMMVLFDVRHAESNVSAAEHGKRLALALLTRWTGDDEYYTMGGRVDTSMFYQLRRAHNRAKDCPMRSSRLQSNQFTTRQRDSWLGHLWLAGEECGISREIRDGVVHHLASAIGVYGPFVKAGDDEA